MTETIFIKFHDPESKKVIESLPHKFVFYDTHVEVFTKNKVISLNEETGIDEEWDINIRCTITKRAMHRVEIYWSHKHKCSAINYIYESGASVLFIEDKKEATEFYLKLQSWMIS